MRKFTAMNPYSGTHVPCTPHAAEGALEVDAAGGEGSYVGDEAFFAFLSMGLVEDPPLTAAMGRA